MPPKRDVEQTDNVPEAKKPEADKPKCEVDKYFDKVNAVLDREGHKKYSLVVGADTDGEEIESEKITAKQIVTMRLIIVSERREALIDEYKHDFGFEGFMMTSTSDSYDVIDEIPRQLAKISRVKTQFWFRDTDIPEEAEAACNSLFRAWTKILKQTDVELGIDPEYTRPGVCALLKTFVDDLHDSGLVDVKWSVPKNCK